MNLFAVLSNCCQVVLLEYQWDPILSFSHSFLPKASVPEVGAPNGSAPPPPNGKSWIHRCKRSFG